MNFNILWIKFSYLGLGFHIMNELERRHNDNNKFTYLINFVSTIKSVKIIMSHVPNKIETPKKKKKETYD